MSRTTIFLQFGGSVVVSDVRPQGKPAVPHAGGAGPDAEPAQGAEKGDASPATEPGGPVGAEPVRTERDIVAELQSRSREISEVVTENLSALLEHAEMFHEDRLSVKVEVDFSPGSILFEGIAFVAGTLIVGAATKEIQDLIRAGLKQELRRALNSYFVPGALKFNVNAVVPSGGPPLKQEPRSERWLGAITALLLLIIGGVGMLLVDQHRSPSSSTQRTTTPDTTAARSPLPSNEQLYRQAIMEAAVKRPGQERSLSTIDTSKPVTVVSLKRRPPEKDDGSLFNYTWVALPDELRARCRGKADPLLAIQEILGLPSYRTAADRDSSNLYQFTVDAKDMFRPCIGKGGLADNACGIETVTDDREKTAFLLDHLWKTYRLDFDDPGYPFTGMGWTFNWSPDATDRFGVSEFIVKKGAKAPEDKPIKSVKIPPAEFCGPPG